MTTDPRTAEQLVDKATALAVSRLALEFPESVLGGVYSVDSIELVFTFEPLHEIRVGLAEVMTPRIIRRPTPI